MNKKIYHKRGRKPKRKVMLPVGGRVYHEHVDGIVKMYVLDGMTIMDIMRLCGTGSPTGIGRICRRGKRYLEGRATPRDERYFETTAQYTTALDTLISKPHWSCGQVARMTGLSISVVHKIAARNGLERRYE